MNNADLYSIVVPVYGCNSTLEELCKRVDNVLEKYEVILVDDRKDDSTWSTIESLCNNDSRIKGVRLSRNFGQHYAITAGLNYVKGDWVIVMDCDLQDVPEEIPKLISKAAEGFDMVFARRKNRKDSFLKKLSSRLFYGTFSYLTNTKQDHTIANFGLYKRKVIKAVLSMDDQVRYFPTMVQWVGFKKATINVQHAERAEGKSSYSLKKLLELAVNNMIAFSDKPLKITVKFGFLMSLITFLVGIYYLIQYFRGEIFQLGFTSLILSIWFLSGIIIAILGILGLYIGKTFEKVKNRPTYIVDELINTETHEK